MSFPSVFTNKHILIMTVSRPDDFPKILDHFPKISYTMTVFTIFRRFSITFRRSVIKMQELSAGKRNASEHFFENSFNADTKMI